MATSIIIIIKVTSLPRTAVNLEATDFQRLVLQGEVRKILAKAEQAIYMVNQLQLFSDNEEIDEVASNEIKYMLLPALLAYFHNLNTHASRLETVQKAKREFYLTQVKRWINTALDELESLDSEDQILKHMAQMKKQGAKSHSSGQASGEGQAQKPKTKPFRPFILTKDLVQKQVFGLGYPSIPTMSIEEFYQQKVNDGTFSIPQCGQGGHSMQEMAENPEKEKADIEKEEEEKEKKEEEEDEELLRRARNMDEYKDEREN
nr:hypothetical protein BaRGS_007973 [Batillaria attramentaria]